jgi:hypothetical protein
MTEPIGNIFLCYMDGGDLLTHQNVSFNKAKKVFASARRQFARFKQEFERRSVAGYKYVPNYTFEWRSLVAEGHIVTMSEFYKSLIAGIDEN